MTEQIRIVTSTMSFDTVSSSITPKVTSISSSSSKTSTSRASSTLSTPTTSARTLLESSSSSPPVSSGVVGAVSSIGAVIVCALLAWILVRRKRKRDEKTRLEQDNADEYAHPAPYTYPMDRPHSAEAIRHASMATSELDGNMQVMVRESLISELEQPGSSSGKDQREAQAPSELHGSTHSEPTSRRPSPLSYVTCQTPQTDSMYLSDDNQCSESLVRQSRLLKVLQSYQPEHCGQVILAIFAIHIEKAIQTLIWENGAELVEGFVFVFQNLLVPRRHLLHSTQL
jgi:hypothetical protein